MHQLKKSQDTFCYINCIQTSVILNILKHYLCYISGNMGRVLPEYLSKWTTNKVKEGKIETFDLA